MGQSNSGIYFSQSSGIIENCTISGNMFGIQSYESNVNITRTNCSYNSTKNLLCLPPPDKIHTSGLSGK